MRFNAFLSFVGGRLSSWNEDIILDLILDNSSLFNFKATGPILAGKQ